MKREAKRRKRAVDIPTAPSRPLSTREAWTLVMAAVERDKPAAKATEAGKEAVAASVQLLRHSPCTDVNRAALKRALREKGMELAEGEIMHIINFPPYETAELYDVVTGLFDRYTAEQHDELLAVVQQSRTGKCQCARCQAKKR